MSQSKRRSVVMISKNVADVIGECLDSVQWADEIIVLATERRLLWLISDSEEEDKVKVR